MILNSLERNTVLLANSITIVSIDQKVAPQHQRITAAFRKQAAFERGIFVFCQGVNIEAKIFVDGNGHVTAE